MLGIAAAVRTARVDLLRAAIDNGSSGQATIKFYDGTRPGTGGSISGQNLLGTLQLPSPCGVSASGQLVFSGIASGVVALAGTATWFRVYDRTGAFVCDGSVGMSGADINFPAVLWAAGDALQLAALTWTDGNP